MTTRLLEDRDGRARREGHTMTDEEINTAIARELGWREATNADWANDEDCNPDLCPWVDAAGVHSLYLEDWTESLDICFRDLAPVAKARGWEMEFAQSADGYWFRFLRDSSEVDGVAEGSAPSPARAFCLAWLKMSSTERSHRFRTDRKLTEEDLAVITKDIGTVETTPISWPDHEADAKSLDLLCDLRRVLKEYQALGKGHDVYGLLDFLVRQSVDSEDILNQLEEIISAADLLNRVLG